ncbi:hypothetical protein DY000_02016529 [Brassica cretica]|uniref:Uncharacterized protein n=1 Tax=Brassica cretica TaxID=69181 RepID=A0ABQ7CWB2_BRACR|nr:hypothetical protein DY000_02016529 [Brassica cretica]
MHQDSKHNPARDSVKLSKGFKIGGRGPAQKVFRGCEPRNVEKRISLDDVSIVSMDRPPRPRARTVSTRVTLPMGEDDPHRGHLAHGRGRPAPRSPRPWARTDLLSRNCASSPKFP